MTNKPHVHLLSARWANWPWGFGNEVWRALDRMGCRITDTDFRVAGPRFLPDRLKMEAELTLVLKGDGIHPDWIRSTPGITALWFPDDLIATEHGPALIKYNGAAFDLVYGNSRHDLGEYAKCGVENAQWLPLACDPTLHRKLKDVEKKHDVTFIGSMFPNREEFVERLRKRFDVFTPKAYGEEMVRVYNESRIVLNLSVGPGNIPHRLFEALGCGSFLLTDHLPEEDRLFENETHLVYYKDDDIEDLIAYYLERVDKRETIAKQGRREVLGKHTVAHRLERIFEDARSLSK